MNNVFLVVKNYYRMFLTKLLKNKNKGLMLGVVAVGGTLLFTVMFAYVSYTTIITSIEAGMPSLALSSFTTTLLMFTFMLIVTESSPTKKPTDENMLLSLPFTKRQIVSAKIIYYLTFDLIVILLLLLPSYVIYYFVVGNVSFVLVLRALYVIILSTMIATGISGALRILFVRITKSFKYSEIIKTSLSVLMLFIFVIFYCFFAFFSQDVENAGEIYNMYPVVLITSFVEKGLFSSFIILSVISFAIFIFSIILRSYYIGKSSSTYRSKNKELKFEVSSVRKSLYKREINKYLSIPIYVSNTIFGPIFTILISVIILLLGKEYFIDLIETFLSVGYESGQAPEHIMNIIDGYFDIGLIIIFSLVLTTTPTTASSISLEHKELWILKAHPISYKDVFSSKILVNLTVTSIAILIYSFLLSFRINLLELLFLMIIPLLSVLLSSIIGLYSNLVYPRLEWESEHEVVKQGFSIIVSMILNLVMVIIPFIIYFNIFVDHYIALLIVVLVFIILNVVWYILLIKKGKKLYEKL